MKEKVIFIGILFGILIMAMGGAAALISGNKLPQDWLSPGKLSPAHSEAVEKCQDCHQGFRKISDDSCLSASCHDDLASDFQLINFNGDGSITNKEQALSLFHQQTDKSCLDCHTEHQGNNSLTPVAFDHEIFLGGQADYQCLDCHDKPADNYHQLLSNQCEDCHNTQTWQTAKFDHKQVSDISCNKCHDIPKNDGFHLGLANSNCSNCHNTQTWQPAKFDHQQYFPITGDHKASCETCHSQNNYNDYTCYGCHEHTERKIYKEHIEEGIFDYNDCMECHRDGREPKKTKKKDSKKKTTNSTKGSVYLQFFKD